MTQQSNSIRNANSRHDRAAQPWNEHRFGIEAVRNEMQADGVETRAAVTSTPWPTAMLGGLISLAANCIEKILFPPRPSVVD